MKRSLILFFFLLTEAVQAATWRLAVIGDVPYSAYERRELPKMLDDIAAEAADLIVHAGDIKHGNDRCNDEIYRDRHALFNASRVPLVFVPGDNEWTDCRRLVAGRFDPLERLDHLRRIFFAEPHSLGKVRIPVERQSDAFPEHLRWRLGPVFFVSLNVPGPSNNYGLGRSPSPEFSARNPLLLDWLRQGFAAARREKSPGIVIVMQANPGFKHFAAGFAHEGYRELLETLRRETLDFAGQVLLVHGDTHWQRIDQPLRHPVTKERVANFTRLETFGYPFMGWVKVFIDTDNPSLFHFEARPYQRN